MPWPYLLVATDDVETAEAIRATLTAEGYGVHTVGHAADALPVSAEIAPPARGLMGPAVPILRTPLTPEALRDIARRALGVL